MRLITFLEATDEQDNKLGGGAGVLIYVPSTGRMLIQQRGEHPDDKDSGKFDFFGGTLEEGETAEECARREAKEEGQIDFPEGALEEIGAFSSTEGGDWDGEPYHVFMFSATNEFRPKIQAEEVAKAGWIHPSELNDKNSTNRVVKALAHEKVRDLLRVDVEESAPVNPTLLEQDDDEGWWYHVTSLANMPSIASQGLQPGAGSAKFGGGYAGHSTGRIFFATDPESAQAWFNKVQQNLELASDNPFEQTAVILRVDPDYFYGEDDPQVDEPGTRDVGDSKFVTVPVDPDDIEVWTPGDQWNERGWHPAGSYHDQPNPSYGHDPWDYQEMDPDYWDEEDYERWPEWEAVMSEAAYPYFGHTFQGDWYHGMASSSRAFIRSKGTHPSNIGIWLTNDRNVAAKFAEQASRRMVDDVPIIVTARVRAENPMVFDTYRDYLDMWKQFSDAEKMRRSLMRKGHDSIIIAQSDTDFQIQRMDLAVFKTSDLSVIEKEKLSEAVLMEKPVHEFAIQDLAGTLAVELLAAREETFKKSQGKLTEVGSIGYLARGGLSDFEDQEIIQGLAQTVVRLSTEAIPEASWQSGRVEMANFSFYRNKSLPPTLNVRVPINMDIGMIKDRIRSNIVHELRHAVDYFLSDGRFIGKGTERMVKSGAAQADYLRFFHEINARFSEVQAYTRRWIERSLKDKGTVNKKHFFKWVLPKMFEERYLEQFPETPLGFNPRKMMSDKRFRRLLSRLSVFFDTVVERYSQ